MARSNRNQGSDEFGARRMPDTGGDLTPTDLDVEGHRRLIAHVDGGPEGARTRLTPDGPDGLRTRTPFIDEDDVEGHLYTGGPSTQGEFIRRAPSDGPHGEGAR